MYSPLFVCVFGPLCLSLFWYALLCVLSRVPIILKRKILFLLSHPCLAILYVLWLFLTVPWVGLQCVIVVFPGHNRFLLHFTNNKHIKINSYNVLGKKFDIITKKAKFNQAIFIIILNNFLDPYPKYNIHSPIRF